MLKIRALKYYSKGYNCSQCILKAASETYGLNLPDECINMCRGISNGLGIGGICSVLIACVMIISILCPEKNIKAYRIKMTDMFAAENGNLNCGKIRKNDCRHIIETSCDILEKIIIENHHNI